MTANRTFRVVDRDGRDVIEPQDVLYEEVALAIAANRRGISFSEARRSWFAVPKDGVEVTAIAV